MSLSNNTTRVIVGVVSIPVIVAISYFGGIYFLLFALGIVLLAFYEFAVMSKKKGAFPNLWLGLIGVSFFIINRYFPLFDTYSFLLLFISLLTLIELFRDKGSAIFNIGTTLAGVFYVGLFASALIALREFYPNIEGIYSRGGFIIISVFASIWICDSAAYWGGTSLGKHKLFERVSPKKSWEGAIFGFFFAIAGMILAKIFLLDFLSWQNAAAIGIIVGTIGQAGDLIESLFKRDAGVKDSSALIPGHGGIFDRFDSLFYVAPFVFLYLKYFSR